MSERLPAAIRSQSTRPCKCCVSLLDSKEEARQPEQQQEGEADIQAEDTPAEPAGSQSVSNDDLFRAMPEWVAGGVPGRTPAEDEHCDSRLRDEDEQGRGKRQRTAAAGRGCPLGHKDWYVINTLILDPEAVRRLRQLGTASRPALARLVTTLELKIQRGHVLWNPSKFVVTSTGNAFKEMGMTMPA